MKIIMMRTVLINNYLSSYLTNVPDQNSIVVGLILGQTCLGKDHVIHFAKTPFLKTDEEHQSPSEQILGTVMDITDTMVADHARQVTRMLPGGIYVLGIFIVSSEDLLNPFNAKIKSILSCISKQLNSNKYLYGNSSDEKLVLNYNTTSKKYSCKSYNVLNFNTLPCDLQFLPNSSKWIQVECNLEIDHLRYLQKTEADWNLQKHFEVILNKLYDSLDTATYFFDSEFRDGDEYLDNSEKKKTRGKRSQKNDTNEDQFSNKPIKISIFQKKYSSASDTYSILETCGQLRIVGQVASKLWLQPKLTVNEAAVAVKQDIMRSLASRLEMHWDSLTEEENLEDINCVHEPPRRVLIELPNNGITLSDYLFPGEGPQDAKASLEELLDIKIKGKLKIQDVEGQADISQFYDGALDSESTEILQLSKGSNKFVYIAAVIGALVLLISIILHFYSS